MKNPIRAIAAALTVVSLALALSGCVNAPEPEPTPTPVFSVTATIDGEPFNPGQSIQFDTLVPNQTQTKVLIITNEGDINALITDLGIVQNGNIFDNGAVTVDIVTTDGVAIAGTVVPAGKTVNASIVLKTADNLGSGLTGSIALNFKAVESTAPAPTPTETDEP